MLYRDLQLAGETPRFGVVLAWQALVYGVWLPVAALVWRTFHNGLSQPAVRRFLLIGVAAIPVHAIGATFIDIAFSNPGMTDLIALAVHRLQLDMLIYTSFGIVALAAEFHRRAADEAAGASAIRLAMEQLRKTSAADPAHDARGPLFVSVGSKKLAVAMEDVEWFGSAANYVVVNWNGREGLIRKTIGTLEEELDPLAFARIHRTAVINLSKVQAAESLSDGSWRLRMESGTELVASRTYRSKILDRLNLR